MAMQIIQLLKKLPRTNCGECDYATCMAFATHVLREGEELGRCPHMDAAARVEMTAVLDGERAAGKTAYPAHFISAKKHVMAKIADFDLAVLAPALGVGFEYEGCDGEDSLIVPLLGRRYAVSKTAVHSLDGPQQDVWEHILLFNYIAMAGREPPAGEWVAMKALPGALAKSKAFAEGCEEPIAAGFGGRPADLVRVLKSLGAETPELETNADILAVFYPLPRVPFLLLFWDRDDDEDELPAMVKIMFDRTVLGYLDIESLVFLGEKTAARLLELTT
ncbi:MAG: DUF3786 domain-containing protein [Deltaproteobacteria bacterium]|nr:DUF3786 domain-containing protein [Candidatus Anaeroferrophillacea bacterium]